MHCGIFESLSVVQILPLNDLGSKNEALLYVLAD